MTTTLSFHDFSDLELLSEGCSSLITYCTQVLHLSEHAAYNRIEAPRAARRFPQILERLADGSIHLTAVRLLAPALTPENHRELLDAARHKSKRDIEHLLAQLNPEPDVASSIRKLPAPAASPLVTDVPPLMELSAAAQLVAKRIPAATSLTPRPWQSSSEGSLLLPHNPPIGVPDPTYGGTPLDQCLYGSLHGWKRETGDFATTVRLLLDAGERPDLTVVPIGRDDVDVVLREHFVRVRRTWSAKG